MTVNYARPERQSKDSSAKRTRTWSYCSDKLFVPLSKGRWKKARSVSGVGTAASACRFLGTAHLRFKSQPPRLPRTDFAQRVARTTANDTWKVSEDCSAAHH